MAIIAEVGVFTISFTTGNFTVNLNNFGGTAPKAVIFLGGEWSDYSLGFSVATPRQSMIYGFEYPGQGSMLNSRFRRNDAVHIGATDGFGGVQASCSHVSFAADQFTVDVGSIGGTGNSNVSFIALGGTDLTDVSIVEWLSSTTNGPRSITGAGFQPDAAINLCTTGTNVFDYGLHTAISFWDGTTNITKQLSSENGVSTTNCKRHLTADALRVTGNSNNVRNQASLTSFDADGFTLNYSQSDSTAFQNYTLCLKGGSFKVGQSLSPISPQTVTEAVGFPANACLALSSADTSFPTVNGGNARFHFGFSDLLGNNRAHSFGSQDGLSTSTTGRTQHTSAAVAIYDSSMSAVDQANVTASGNDLEFNFTGADTTQRVFFYMAIGPPSAPPAPQLAGDATAVADTGGALDVSPQLGGDSTAVADTSGDLTVSQPSIQLAGDSTSVADTGGAVAVSPQLAGDSTSVADTAGNIAVSPIIAGDSTAVADTTGNVAVSGQIAGDATAVANTIGNLSLGAITLAGDSTAVANTAGDVAVSPQLAGDSFAVADTSGDLAVSPQLSGDSTAVANTLGIADVVAPGQLTGNVFAVADTSGDLIQGISPQLAADATGVANTAGNLTVTAPPQLTGDATAVASTAGDTTVVAPPQLTGDATAVADTSGDLISGIRPQLAADTTAVANTLGFVPVGVFTPNPCRICVVPDQGRNAKIESDRTCISTEC